MTVLERIKCYILFLSKNCTPAYLSVGFILVLQIYFGLILMWEILVIKPTFENPFCRVAWHVSSVPRKYYWFQTTFYNTPYNMVLENGELELCSDIVFESFHYDVLFLAVNYLSKHRFVCTYMYLSDRLIYCLSYGYNSVGLCMHA